MGKQVNDISLSVLDYQGYDSVSKIAGTSNAPAILTSDDTDFWQNSGRLCFVGRCGYGSCSLRVILAGSNGTMTSHSAQTKKGVVSRR